MVGEEKFKRLFDGFLLSLEQKGDGRPEQKQRRERPPLRPIAELVQTATGSRVGDLIVILEKADEGR